jgi:hypothetical protein
MSQDFTRLETFNVVRVNLETFNIFLISTFLIDTERRYTCES